MSRGGKFWECCQHIIDELETVLPKGTVLDGELYIHGSTFQEITKLVKKQRPESVDVEFHIYDIPKVNNEDAGEWKDRRLLLENLHLHISNHLMITPTETADNEQEVYQLQSKYLEEGYEGAIVREADGEYRFGYRSRSLLKVKNFTDEEYKIVGYTTGVGRFEGSVVWICETWNGEEFKVVPQGTMEERQEAYQNADEKIGDMLKVKFFELTDDGIPRFPVGLGIRANEDMS
jgi:DNA ligase-1